MAVKTNYTKNGNNYYIVTTTVRKPSNEKPIRNYLNVNYINIMAGKLIKLCLFKVLIHSDKTKPPIFISRNCRVLDYISILWKNLLKHLSNEHKKLHSLSHIYVTKSFKKIFQ